MLFLSLSLYIQIYIYLCISFYYGVCIISEYIKNEKINICSYLDFNNFDRIYTNI